MDQTAQAEIKKRTEEEKRKLIEELAKQDPDRQPLDITITGTESFLREILGTLLTETDLAVKYHDKLTTEHWVAEHHKLIFKTLARHVEKYKKLPTKAYLENVLTQELDGKDEAVKLWHLGELNTLLEYHTDHPVPEQIDDHLRHFVFEQQSKVDLLRFMDARNNKKVSYEEQTQFLKTMIENRERNLAGSEDADLCDLDTFFAETSSEYKYLVPRRIPQGKLMVIPGPAKKGKTTCIIQSFIDLVYTGSFWGEAADPFPFYYVDYENDTAYLKHCILNPVMEGRDWTDLKKWFRVSNRQVDNKAYKLPPHVTTDFLDQIAKRMTQPGFFLIDSLRRSFGRKPGLKSNWEWDANCISGLLDPFSEWSHKTGHTVGFIHHANHEGRASGSTDILAVPDVLIDFEVVKAPGTGQDTTQRRVKIGGRIDHTPPHTLEFDDGVYRYLGAGEDAAAALSEENLANAMAHVVRHLESSGPESGAAMLRSFKADKLNLSSAKLYDALRALEAEKIVENDAKKKKYGLVTGYADLWGPFKAKLGLKATNWTPGKEA
ncbi:hypothetical protein GobsT_18400 [Gemmata obscuriglobus]|nr:AAA family ATPase [Gemmata obscuriglobus]QEG27087.1 hypothetical protein GobsT_18400 [Gemmata obscuriglobus]VTS03556.1 hypothetical protein : : DnaB: AAA_25 [Gemmata obscuriglobus UQM 2246]